MGVIIFIGILIALKQIAINTAPPTPAPRPVKTKRQVEYEEFLNDIIQVISKSETLLDLNDLRAYYPSMNIRPLSVACNTLVNDNLLICIYIKHHAYYGTPNKKYFINF